MMSAELRQSVMDAIDGLPHLAVCTLYLAVQYSRALDGDLSHVVGLVLATDEVSAHAAIPDSHVMPGWGAVQLRSFGELVVSGTVPRFIGEW
jgi:hypothetical protein